MNIYTSTQITAGRFFGLVNLPQQEDDGGTGVKADCSGLGRVCNAPGNVASWILGLANELALAAIAVGVIAFLFTKEWKIKGLVSVLAGIVVLVIAAQFDGFITGGKGIVERALSD